MIGVGHLDVLSGIGDLNCIGFGIGNEAEWTLALGDGIFAEVKRLSLGGTVLADGDGIDDLALLEVNRTVRRGDILRRGDGKLGTFKTTVPVNRLILDNRLFIDRLGGFCRSCGLLGGSGCCFRGRSGVLGRNGCFLCRSSCFLCDSRFRHFFLVDGCKNIAGLKDGDRAFFQNIGKGYRGCFVVFDGHGFGVLYNIFIGGSFGNGVGAGQQTCQAELAIFVGLCCLIVILACDSEFDISYNAVLRSFDDFEVALLQLVFKADGCGFAILYLNALGSCATYLSEGDSVTV